MPAKVAAHRAVDKENGKVGFWKLWQLVDVGEVINFGW